jgi:hypothetical protein
MVGRVCIANSFGVCCDNEATVRIFKWTCGDNTYDVRSEEARRRQQLQQIPPFVKSYSADWWACEKHTGCEITTWREHGVLRFIVVNTLHAETIIFIPRVLRL